MVSKTITIKLPDSAQVPSSVEADQDLLRHALAGVLYKKGILSGKEARQITGNTRREFEENLAKYGFSIMPDTDEDLESELNA